MAKEVLKLVNIVEMALKQAVFHHGPASGHAPALVGSPLESRKTAVLD